MESMVVYLRVLMGTRFFCQHLEYTGSIHYKMRELMVTIGRVRKMFILLVHRILVSVQMIHIMMTMPAALVCPFVPFAKQTHLLLQVTLPKEPSMACSPSMKTATRYISHKEICSIRHRQIRGGSRNTSGIMLVERVILLNIQTKVQFMKTA